MHLLRRSLTRLFLERHLTGFAQSALPPLHHRPQFGKEYAPKNVIQRFRVLVEGQIHHEGRHLARLAQHMQDALCHKGKHRRVPLEHPALSTESTLKLLSKVDDRRLAPPNKWLGFVTKGELDWLIAKKKETCSHEDAFLDLTVTEPPTTFSWTCGSRIQGKYIELAGGSSPLNSRLSYPWNVFSWNIRKEFHSLAKEVAVVDPTMRSSSDNETREVSNDGAIMGHAKVMPEKDTGKSAEKQVLKTYPDITENLETRWREDKEAVRFQSASKLPVKETASLLDENNDWRIHGNLFSLNQDENTLKIATSPKKKVGRVSPPYAKGYFTVMDRMKNKKRRKQKKNWNADQQLGPEDFKHLSLAPHLDPIATAGTNLCKEPRMHFPAGLFKSNKTMSRIISPVKSKESIEYVDTCGINVLNMKINENQSNSLEQEVSEKVDCVERLEEHDIHEKLALEAEHAKRPKDFFCEKGSSEMRIVSEDLNTTLPVVEIITPGPILLMGNTQKSATDMESNSQKGRHMMEIKAKGRDTFNEDAFSFIQNKGEVIVDDGCKASTTSDFFSKSWMNAQIETVEKGRDKVCDYAGASKVNYPLTNFDFKEFYIILDLNGVLIKRWDVNPSLPGVSKLNKRWIQLRPGCIEFLCKIFSEFRVGIWSTMTPKNVLGVCKLLEQQAHQPLPFFMLWSKESCYQHRGIQRPDKSHVLADFKPLSRVWSFFKPYLGSHNTVLVDDSPYKACMNCPYNCIFPDAYEGCTNDDYLNNVLWPYLQKMKMSQDIQAHIANNRFGQQPVVVGHRLYHHVQQVMDVFYNTPLAQQS